MSDDSAAVDSDTPKRVPICRLVTPAHKLAITSFSLSLRTAAADRAAATSRRMDACPFSSSQIDDEAAAVWFQAIGGSMRCFIREANGSHRHADLSRIPRNFRL